MVDRKAAARAIEQFLSALGHEAVGELADTAERVADAWADDLLEGESVDVAALLRGAVVEVGDTGAGLVVLRDLAVTTVCPHHLPAIGRGTIIYQPSHRIAGIGALARALDALSRRLTLQEDIGQELVDLIMSELGARGALCEIELMHTCLSARAERKETARVTTVSVAGTFGHACADRDLALSTLARGSR